ncbi:MAG: acetyl-CoA acetyltransferase [Solirubrobacteraceae bacterium]
MGSDGGLDPRTPVIVGAGQALQRPGTQAGDSVDPVGLAVRALRAAAADRGAGDRLLRRADSIRHVATSGWLYRDEAALVAEALGASPRETVRTSAFGGDGPVRLLGDSARAIAAGEADVVLLAGAEALATLRSAQRAGARPDWPEQEIGAPTRVLGSDRPPANEAEQAVGLMAPATVYALLECAVRGALGAGQREHFNGIAALWSAFSAVAARNPHAWIQREHSAGEIAGEHEGNRMIATPYRKLMCANIAVDQAAALILCSAQAAAGAGVPRDRWVFPLACAHATDRWFVSERADLAASPAIAATGRAVLEHAHASFDEVAHIDVYSCFPSAVQIAARALGLPLHDPARPLTVTGGLTFAGGPGNNYSMHGIAALVGRLREEPDALGFGSALGWYCTKHACAIYSGRAPRRPFREIDANPHIERPPARRATAAHSGIATVEAYTVTHARDGAPEALIVSAITPDGARALVRETDQHTIAETLDCDPLGARLEIVAGADGHLELDSHAVERPRELPVT